MSLGFRIVQIIVCAILMVTPLTILSLGALIHLIPKNYPDWVDWVIVYFVHLIIFSVGWFASRHEKNRFNL